jgi:hypothetical protein
MNSGATPAILPLHTRPIAWFSRPLTAAGIYSGLVMSLDTFDLEEIASALADQIDYERQWLIDPGTGKIVFWTADTGIDGHTPVDLDDRPVHPLTGEPSYWVTLRAMRVLRWWDQ